MAKGYRPVDRDQVFLFPPDMREWLPADHPVWLVIRVVEQYLGTGAFHAARRTGGAGAAGYDPDMLLAVLVWAYAHRESSSRRMEELCRTDVGFRVICGGNLPDHSTIARFRQEFPGAVAGFFAQVLVLCARLGMGRLGTVALDGTKIAASASKAANRGEEKLRELAGQAVAAHAEADAAEGELVGEGRRGDELPPDAWSPRRRRERIAGALAQLEAGRQAAEAERDAKAQEFRARREAGQRTGPPPAGAGVALAQENLARVIADRGAQLAALARRDAAGPPRRGRRAGVQDYCRVREAAAKVEAAREREAQRRAAAARAAGPGPVRNITDPDSRLMPTRNGVHPGIQRAERDQRRRAGHRHRADRRYHRHGLVLPDDVPGRCRRRPDRGEPSRPPGRRCAGQRRDRAGAGRRGVLPGGEPHLPGPGPAHRGRQAPRPGKSRPR